MRQYYFKGITSLDGLKERRKELAKQFHPDINNNVNANEKMQAINIEYEYVSKNLPQKKETVTQDTEFLKRAAQNIFHALTNANAVDYNLLVQTINSVPFEYYKPLSVIYFRTYGFHLINHIEELVKDKKIKEAIKIGFKISTDKSSGITDLFKFMFKNFK